MSCTVLEQVFQSMRYNRKYSSGFIASRQKLGKSSVTSALNTLAKNGMVEVVISTADKRRRLYISKQQHFSFL